MRTLRLTFQISWKSISFFKFTLFLMGLVFGVAAQNTIEMGTSPNPVGSGARAMGMGNAFIAIADDATLSPIILSLGCHAT